MKCPYCGHEQGFNAQEIKIPNSLDCSSTPISAYAICCGGCDKCIGLLPADYI